MNSGDAEVDLGEYYGDVRFWIILVLVLLATTIVGHAKGAKPKQLNPVS